MHKMLCDITLMGLVLNSISTDAGLLTSIGKQLHVLFRLGLVFDVVHRIQDAAADLIACSQMSASQAKRSTGIGQLDKTEDSVWMLAGPEYAQCSMSVILPLYPHLKHAT